MDTTIKNIQQIFYIFSPEDNWLTLHIQISFFVFSLILIFLFSSYLLRNTTSGVMISMFIELVPLYFLKIHMKLSFRRENFTTKLVKNNEFDLQRIWIKLSKYSSSWFNTKWLPQSRFEKMVNIICSWTDYTNNKIIILYKTSFSYESKLKS